MVSRLNCDCIDRKSETSAPRRCCIFCDIDENPDVEAVSIEKGALALAEESGISMSEEDFDGYFLFLLFVFSSRFDLAVAYCPDL